MHGTPRQSGFARAVRGFLAAVVMVVLLVPAVAQAQDAPALASLSTVLAVHGAGQPDTLIVFAEAPQGTPLPAKISVAVPKGLKPDWVGEIVGTDPSKDPTAQYTVAAGKDFDIATLTLSRGLKGQLEFTVPGQASGSTYTLNQPIIGPVGSASVAFQIPAGSTLSGQSQGLVKEGTSGDSDRYSKTVTKPKVGSKITASTAVKLGAAAQTPQAGQQPSAGQPQQNGAPQAQAGAQPTAPASSGSSGFPWMTVVVLGSIAFFAYNYYRWRQVKAAQAAVDTVAPAEGRAAARAPRSNAHVEEADGEFEDNAKDGEPVRAAGIQEAEPDVAIDKELKALDDKRSRGELTREEYLARKRQLLGGNENGTSAIQGI